MENLETVDIGNWADFSERAVSSGAGNWIYRGVIEVSYKLIPKVGRPRTHGLPYCKHDELVALERFKRAALPHLEFAPENTPQWMSVAQHHGLPTRLLDWSESPFIALYFAVRKGKAQLYDHSVSNSLGIDIGPVLKDIQRQHSEIYGPDISSEYTVSFPVAAALYAIPAPPLLDSESATNDEILLKPGTDVRLYQPNHLTSRITVQRAAHTIHFDPATPWEPELGELWYIRPQLIFEFKANLNTVGINEASLFPDLDGVSKYYDWLYWRGW